MARHGALISGSFAIQFFERVRWNESDLDIFIENGTDAGDFEQYLCGTEKYHMTRERDEAEEVYLAMSELVKVFETPKFFKLVTMPSLTGSI